jgi:hypothetical protein
MRLQPLRLPPDTDLPLPSICPRRARARRLALPLALPVVLLAALGCRDTFAGFGTGARARASAEQAFAAIADRHLDIVRNGRYEYARQHLTRGALSPSRVFDDSAAWTAMNGPVRLLEVYGTLAGDRYTMTARSSVPAPVRPADGRHVVSLVRLSGNEYRWETTVDYALGAVRPADIAAVITRLLAAGEGRSERELRADLAASAPRTSAALGTVFSLDSLRPTSLADGTTAVTLGIAVSSKRLERRLPALAQYIHKYVEPAQYHFVIADRASTPYLDISAKDRFITIKVRTLRGQLVPLSGPPRPMPDSLLVLADFRMKIKIFHVGFHDLVLELVNSAQGDRERDWTMTAHREPRWDLPLITARLLRSPLRRPFVGEGALFRIGVRAGENGGPTVIMRQSHLTVQESAILNFLNSLGNTAMEDFGGAVEREENAWLRELFLGLRDDARAAID